ncbi:MAG TPA: formate/nitrite transporter family protein [Gemmatimonadales bacterium]|nr:formate/nitrite transporter family protein [Gemmatimonadales bacterium]
MAEPPRGIAPEHRNAPPPEPAKDTRLSAAEIHDNILEPAERELVRPVWAVLLSALSSGLAIGFSFLAGGYVQLLVPDGLGQAAAAAVYPLGFIFVIMARSALFTENTLVPILPLLNRRDLRTLWRVFRLWGLLLLGNLVGAAIFAWALASTPMIDAVLAAPLAKVSMHATAGGFWLVAYQAIFAGWLIALLTWLLGSTRATGAQLALIWLATAPISAFHFRHSIAGSVEAFYRVAIHSASLGQMAGEFIVPAVLGNAVGGVIIVALLNYGQVAADRRG